MTYVWRRSKCCSYTQHQSAVKYRVSVDTPLSTSSACSRNPPSRPVRTVVIALRPPSLPPPPTANMERKSQGYRMEVEGEKKTLGEKKIDEGEKSKKIPKKVFLATDLRPFHDLPWFMSLHCHGYRSDGGAVVLQNQNQQVQGASMNHLTPWICRLRKQQG